MSVKSGQNVTRLFATSNPTTGAAADADVLPVGTLYVNGVADDATIIITNIATGLYSAAFILPALAAGDSVDLRISATVAGVAGEGIVWADNADTKLVSDLTDTNAQEIADDVYDSLIAMLSLIVGLGIGPGVGSTLYEDTLTGAYGTPIGKAIVRVYPFSNNTTDWINCKGSCTTELDGTYHLHLDPGTYTRRVWKNGTVILDDRLTIA